MDTPAEPRQPVVRTARSPGKFTSGSLLNHILVMTGTGAIGLVAIFVGDLANMLFLSWLGDQAIVAAVGYGSSIVLVTISIGIGLAIATSALVSRAGGAGRLVLARRLSANAHLLAFLVSAVLAFVVWLSVPSLLSLLGATGRTHDLARQYLEILVPALPPLAVGMTSMAVLRSVGDARRAMNVTLAGAITNVVLDPIFIFGLGLGIQGAAIASLVARIVILAVGLYGVIRVHNIMARPRLRLFLRDAPAFAMIAVPAVLTNIATPAANAYVTAAVAPFGDSAVAGWAVIGRVLPVAFGAIYALSGSVGPILGQNFGAANHRRMRQTFTLSLWVTAAFTIGAWLVLAIAAYPIADTFHAEGEARALIVFFCRWLSPLFFFMGALFVANAAFNTLGRPHFSTALNWARATIGTIPFVSLGASISGAEGAIAGHMLGGIVFGLVAVMLCYAMFRNLEATDPRLVSTESAHRAH